MRRDILAGVVTLVITAVCTIPVVASPEFYYDRDSAYAVAPTDKKIAVQFDTTNGSVEKTEFMTAHRCLDGSVPEEYLARGFWTYALQPPWDFDSAASDLLGDTAVHRVVPVYITLLDAAEIQVTDMVSVQFDFDLPSDSALTILNTFGLTFLDSSEFVHNLWHAALHDTISRLLKNTGNAEHRRLCHPERSEGSAVSFYENNSRVFAPPKDNEAQNDMVLAFSATC